MCMYYEMELEPRKMHACIASIVCSFSFTKQPHWKIGQ